MKERRTNYFIKKNFQAKFILKFCALVVLTAVISAFVIYLFLSRSVTTVFENSRISIKQSTEFIMPGLVLSGLISITLAGVAAMALLLFVSHRIAGPLFKLENSIDRVGDGDISFDISFRKGDETTIIAEVFNRSRKKLNAMIGDIKKEFKQLAGEINTIKKTSDSMPEEARGIRNSVEVLEKASGELEAKIGKFKL